MIDSQNCQFRAQEMIIHPSVFINIFAHTIKDFHSMNTFQREIGVLLGYEEACCAWINISYEAIYSVTSNRKELDLRALERKLSAILGVLPNYKILGWYSTYKLSNSEMNFYRNLTSIIENPLFLVWNDAFEEITNQEVFKFELYKSYKGEFNSEIFTEFKKLPYTIGVNQLSSPDSPTKSKRLSNENPSSNIYYKKIQEIKEILLDPLIAKTRNSLFQSDKVCFSNLLVNTQYMDAYIDIENAEVKEDSLSRVVLFIKMTATSISKFLKELKELIMSTDVRENQFLEENFRVIKRCFKKINKKTIFKETGCIDIQEIQDFISSRTNVIDILAIINCIIYDNPKEKPISLNYLFKWIEISWSYYNNFILKSLCKRDVQLLSKGEKNYLIWKLKNCEVIVEYENHEKWNHLPIDRFEEFFLLWAFAIHNKVDEIIEKFEHLTTEVYKKFIEFKEPTDGEIGSFFYFLFAILSKSQLYCNIGEYIDNIVNKIKTRETVDNMMKVIILLKKECKFKEMPFIQALDGVFSKANQLLLFKLFNIFEGFGNNFISHYLERFSQLSEEEYRQRVSYALDILTKYIYGYKRYLNVSILENLDQKIKIENFWYDNDYKNDLRELTKLQIETGVFEKSFLDKYFETLMSESNDSTTIDDWTKNIKLLLIYMLFSENNEEKQDKQEMIFKYIIRFASNICKFSKSENMDSLYAILKLSCRFIQGLQDQLHQIFTKICDEYAQISPLNLPPAILNTFLIINESSKWQFKEASNSIPSIILAVLDRVVYCLENWSPDKISKSLHDDLTEMTRDELYNFDIKYIHWEDCQKNDTIAKYLVTLLIDIGLENMDKKLDYDEYNAESYDKMEDYKQTLVEVFKELSNCFAFKAIFDTNNHFAVRQLLVSRFLGVFQCIYDSCNLKIVLYELNSYASAAIMEEPERLPTKIEKELKKIIHYQAAVTAYKNIDLDVTKLDNFKFDLFRFPLRNKVLGITLFGGTIILDSSLFYKSRDVSKCFQKITFAHEIAHLLRRRSNDGFYNADIKTPNISGVFTHQSQEDINFNGEQICNEGGGQLEMELFGSYPAGVNKKQIKYLNKIKNWNQTLPDFRKNLENLVDETLFVYYYSRVENGLHKIDRVPHSEA